MRSVSEALQEILSAVPLLGTERVQLLDANGRVLAESIQSGRALPPRDNSAMDGYALRAADSAGASEKTPKSLRLAGEVLAGMLPKEAVKPGECVRITTGAPVPEGADAVIMQEHTKEEGNHILLQSEVAPKENIRFASEDVRVGEQVLDAGANITASRIGLLALLGRSVVEVRRRPQVAILSSGDELVGIDGDTEGWKTVDSNAYTTAAQVKEAGGEPILLPIAPDNREKIRELLRQVARADVVISTAGVSVGPHDFVRAALEDVGFKLSFWRVRQRPGSPLAFGLWDGRPVFGLPGNPVSAAVCFEIYVRPALRRMAGWNDIFRPVVPAKLLGTVRTKPSHTYFLRARLVREGTGWSVTSSGLQSSGAVKPLAQGNSLIVVAEGRETPDEGNEVPVVVLDSSALDLPPGGIASALGFAP